MGTAAIEVNRMESEADRLLLRIGSVMRITGLGRSTIYRLVADNAFPAPVRLTKRAVAWRRSELEQWSRARPMATH